MVDKVIASISVSTRTNRYTNHPNTGAWWWLLHHPDRALAALPAAAYSKIQLYAPFMLRHDMARLDATLHGVKALYSRFFASVATPH